MSDEPMISYAQNGEDVVLWRALGDIPRGIYVDVGGFDPDEDSVTRVFFDHGWRGIDVEPVPELAERFRDRRPGNEVVEAAITDQDVGAVVLHWFDSTGLSTLDDDFADRHDRAGFDHQRIEVPALRLDDVLTRSLLVTDTIHFLKIDVEGAEDQVIRSLDLTRWRPWVLVVEATEPNSTATTHQAWEPMLLDAGYTFALFDGLSRFYVSPEHPELVALTSYPACILDGYTTARQAEVEQRLVELDTRLNEALGSLQNAEQAATRWRNATGVYWAEAVAQVQASEAVAAQARVDADRWRRQHTKAKETLQQVRGDRNRLRQRVRKMRGRIDRMSRRVAVLDEQIRSREQTRRARARQRLARVRAKP